MNNTLLIIPHFNNAESLYISIKSIHGSENIDVLVIDDGSINNRPQEEKLIKNKKFIGELFFIQNPNNQGIETVLNQGLDFALEKGYKYIARLDAGDICYPHRFKIQEEFLNSNQEIYLLGTQVNFINSDGVTLYQKKFPTEDKDIRKMMHINSMFIHPSVMFRSEVISTVGKYPTNYKSAEDFAYFFNIIKKHKAANLDQILLDYEINFDGISMTTRNKQIKSRILILKKNFDFSFWSIYGLFINYIILYTPTNIIQKLKTIVYK